MTDDEKVRSFDYLTNAMRNICDALRLDVLTALYVWDQHQEVILAAVDALEQCRASVDEIDKHLTTLARLVDDEAATS